MNIAQAAPFVEFTAQQQIQKSAIYPEIFLISLRYFERLFYSPKLSFPYNFSSVDAFLRFLFRIFLYNYIGKYGKTDRLEMLLPVLRNTKNLHRTCKEVL